MVNPLFLVPVPGISERDLFEASLVAPVGRAHVEVAANHDVYREALMPVLRLAGAAPGNEPGDLKEADEIPP